MARRPLLDGEAVALRVKGISYMYEAAENVTLITMIWNLLIFHVCTRRESIEVAQ